MRRWVFVICALLAASPAAACNVDMIEIIGWEFDQRELDGRSGVQTTVTYKMLDQRGFRLIDGIIMFRDPFNKALGGVPIPRTEGLSFQETGTATAFSPHHTMKDALKMHADDLNVTACVNRIVYEDGTREAF